MSWFKKSKVEVAPPKDDSRPTKLEYATERARIQREADEAAKGIIQSIRPYDADAYCPKCECLELVRTYDQRMSVSNYSYIGVHQRCVSARAPIPPHLKTSCVMCEFEFLEWAADHEE